MAPYDTAFALLFLAKGDKPVLINKLQWGSGSEWNNDRNDIEHLVQFVNKAKAGEQKFSDQPVAWQTVNLRASLVDLLDAPILYLNGHVFPTFTDAERKKLHNFVDQGGTIFLEACCSKKEFIDGFHAFAAATWPEYAIDRLDPSHPIFSSFYKINNNDWNLEGIQVGCRTSVIFAPGPRLPVGAAGPQAATDRPGVQARREHRRVCHRPGAAEGQAGAGPRGGEAGRRRPARATSSAGRCKWAMLAHSPT